MRQVFDGFQRHFYSQSEHARVVDKVRPQVLGEASSHLTEGACENTHQPLAVLDEHVAQSQPTFLDTRQVVAMI